MRRAALALSLLATISMHPRCGDSSPTSSTSPNSTNPAQSRVTLSVVSGENRQPVGQGSVFVNGTALTTDGNGQVVVDSLTVGADLRIVADGFLTRETRFRSPDETTFTLWPRASATGLDEDFTRRVLYTSTGEDAIPGQEPLFRPSTTNPIILVPSVEIRNDTRAFRIVEESGAVLADALDGMVQVRVGTMTDPGTRVEIVIDADSVSSEFVGQWRTSFDGRTVSSALIEFRSVSILIDNPSLLTHNLGHIAGLRHTDNPNDRMSRRWWERPQNNFAAREVLGMRLAYQRRPGNRFPDNDRDADNNLLRTTRQGAH